MIETLPSRHVLSFGGGVNSVALMILLVTERQPLDEVVFADTGGELPETYAYFDTVRAYLAPHEIPLTVIQVKVAGRDLYQTCWDRKVLPSTLWRWSTRDFKVRPIHKHYRSLGGRINQYMGIAYDEFERMRTSKEDYITNIYPLVDRKITRDGCADIIKQAGLPLPEKSSCFFCPFGSIGRWKRLHERHPDLYEKAVALEENSKHFPSQHLTDPIFRRKNSVSLRELPMHFDWTSDIASEPDSPCGAECMT